MARLFEEPICAGWVYPCSLGDIRNRLTLLPEVDLLGLWAVGLAAATRKDCSANGRYCFSERPTIRLYSYPDTYTYRQPMTTKRVHIEVGLAVEREFGMEVDKIGGRYVCRWSAADLKRFILEHVLLHEVGHHVYHWRRKEQGQTFRPSWRESEQSAESYAVSGTRAADCGDPSVEGNLV